MSIGINTSQIDAMVSQLRSVAARAAAPSQVTDTSPLQAAGMSAGATGAAATPSVSFADALKNSIDQVNKVQNDAQQLGNRFIQGDDKISLSDVMISTQKANISLQASVQVRNKLVAAYNDIMNMQV